MSALLTGMKNGSKSRLYAEISPGVWELIGGQTSHGVTTALAPVESTTKDEPDVRCYIEGEGQLTIEATADIAFSSDGTYQFLLQKSIDRKFVTLAIAYADDPFTADEQFQSLVTATNYTAGQLEMYSGTWTLSSDGVTDLQPPLEQMLYAVDSGTNTLHVIDYDLLESTFSTASPGPTPTGIGGIGGRVFSCDGSGVLYEHDPTTLAVINSNTPAGLANLVGIGGMASRLYIINDSTVIEIDPNTLNPSGVSFPAGLSYRGIGGDNFRLYRCGGTSDFIIQTDPDTGADINVENSPGSNPTGIGGMGDRLFSCDNNSGLIYEHDPVSLAVINSNAPTGINNLLGIGGIKI